MLNLVGVYISKQNTGTIHQKLNLIFVWCLEITSFILKLSGFITHVVSPQELTS